MAWTNPSRELRLKYARHLPRKSTGRLSPDSSRVWRYCPSSGSRTLERLGFKNYGEYIQSPLWQSIRRAVAELRGRFCVMCKEPSQETHHASYRYEVLAGNDIRPLFPLCKACHRKIHDGATLAEANKRMFREMKSKQPTTSKGFSAAFMEFWKNYPRKVAKTEAERSWRKAIERIIEGEEIDEIAARSRILNACIEFGKSDKGKSGKFCPYPATWLNQGRYDDDPSEWSDSVKPPKKPGLRSVDEINAERKW